MDHSHHTCAHNALKFCGHCNTVWCPTCKVEWRQYPIYWNYRFPNYQYQDLGIGSGLTGGAVGMASGAVSGNTIDITNAQQTALSCSHGVS